MVKGTNVVFRGPKGSEEGDGGWFLGTCCKKEWGEKKLTGIAHGEEWWKSPNDANQGGRPHWFGFTVTNLLIENIKVLNPVAWVFSIGGSNVEMRNIFIDARSTDGFPFNTGELPVSINCAG